MNNRDIIIRLPELQDNDKKAKKLRSRELLEGRENFKEVLYYQNFSYVLKVICLELINRYYNNAFAGYFSRKKT